MGLDMYIRKVPAEKIGNKVVDFDLNEDYDDGESFDWDAYKARELFYWRKHPDLHGWFGRLYKEKGGGGARSDGMADPDGNFAGPVRIVEADLDRLEKDLDAKNFPKIDGFFFGQSHPESWEYTREFIKVARDFLKKNPEQAIYYEASW